MRLKTFGTTTLHASVVLVLFSWTSSASAATVVTFDFEGFPDSTILTTQYPGVTFTNAIILTAGISLNEFEFPPHSGVNVASDNNGPMNIDFSTPITTFGAYFTYAEPLTLDGFNAVDALVTSTTSAFSDNEALSGVVGSSPNEFIEVSCAGGISSVTIAGDPLGGSFTLDDATYATASEVVPEPGTVFSMLAGIVAITAIAARKKQQYQ